MSLPRQSRARWAAYAACAIGVALLCTGVVSLLVSHAPDLLLHVALMVAGCVSGVLGYLTLLHNRVAWAFSISLHGVSALIFLFGAPKLGRSLDIPLLLALVPFVAFVATTTLFALERDDFTSTRD